MASLTTPLDWTGGPALLWVLGAALLYRLGGRGRKHRPGDGWRTASFVAGLAAVVIALDSPVDDLSDRLFWVHMVQHILLIGAAAPLLALARPWTRMWGGLPLAFRRDLARTIAGPGAAPLRRAAGFLGGALVSWLLFNLNLCAWHLPVLYDAALRWEFVHALEHLTFFATALLFWTRVIPAAPWRSSLGALGKLAYLGSTMVVGWVLAIVLALATSPLYSPYSEAASRPGHISALTDQQLAAGVMWVPGAFAYLIAIVVIAYRWLEPRDSPGGGPAQAEALPRGVG
ncbi:MAG TPA: cytochrome c oxidase assembly protein [Solirubrobacterales bacterium]|nr:cytochrome c oxidase assembly protein [Solirubrobacterales bacterium]